MMASKPILSSISAGNDPVQEAHCGLSVEAENPKALAAAILNLRNMPASQRQEMGSKGKKYVLEHHGYPILAKQFLIALT
jgi:glycosyltransferase involved in cell wall biosynthesis